MENKDKIEIPFGAKDSELCECEYTIPEGYEAEIKDGKVIIRKKESEDEKIRKEIIEYIKTGTYHKSWIAWLEKQCEQKYSPLCNTVKDKIREYIANHFITDTVVRTDVSSIVHAMEEGVRLGKEEQKPAEWSDHDEDMLNSVKIHLDNAEVDSHFYSWLDNLKDRVQPKQEWSKEDDFMVENVRNSFGLHCGQMTDALKEQYDKFFNKVKSLRPQSQWEPSEEQIKALWELMRYAPSLSVYTKIEKSIESLYSNLKKLKKE